MKKTFLQSCMIITLALLVSWGTHVYAFQEPGSTPPNGNVPAPVNTGTFFQQKAGGLGAFYLKAGNASLDAIFSSLGLSNTAWINGYSLAEKVMVSPWGIFGKLKAGSVSNPNTGSITATLNGLTVDESANTNAGLKIDLSSGAANLARDMINFIAGSSADRVTLIANKPAFQFWSTANNDEADLWGRYFKGDQVELTAGEPAAGKVLTSTNGTGDASWGTVTFSSMDIKGVGTSSTNNTNMVYCPAGYAAMGGGGYCKENFSMKDSRPLLSVQAGKPFSYPETATPDGRPAIGWFTTCEKTSGTDKGGYNTATAVCMKITPGSITYPPSPITGTTSGGSGTPTWQAVTKAHGTVGQTCTAWLASNPSQAGTPTGVSATGARVKATPTTGSGGPGNPSYVYDQCAYAPTDNSGCAALSATNNTASGWWPVASCSNPVSGYSYVTETLR